MASLFNKDNKQAEGAEQISGGGGGLRSDQNIGRDVGIGLGGGSLGGTGGFSISGGGGIGNTAATSGLSGLGAGQGLGNKMDDIGLGRGLDSGPGLDASKDIGSPLGGTGQGTAGGGLGGGRTYASTTSRFASSGGGSST
ncbi:Poly (ADP-ribose) polymerase family, member 8 [Balamuthia mandrillaris]